jgi:hypothetical protein
MNLECAVTPEMIEIACQVKPHDVCLVPEKRQEVTTEGGLDVVGHFENVKNATQRLIAAGITVSIFIDPDEQQIAKAKETGATVIELHTGKYADTNGVEQLKELERIKAAAKFGHSIGLKVNAGHGLHEGNVQAIAEILEIAELNIGSRPASRKANQKIEDLRAIPWGFSWGQCRLTLPGWYGFGSAVEKFLDRPTDKERKAALALLQKMVKQWPFFKTLLSNMDMVLAKSDLALASRYSELVTDAKLRKKVFMAIEAEWHRTADIMTLLTGEKHRLANNPALARSIRHRFPYIDPLHHLQVELIRRYREGKADERVQRGIHLSINGISAGLRNTG